MNKTTLKEKEKPYLLPNVLRVLFSSPQTIDRESFTIKETIQVSIICAMSEGNSNRLYYSMM